MSSPVPLRRPRFAGLSLTPALLLLAVLAGAGCAATVEVGTPASEDLLDRLPSRATVIGWFNLEELRDSELVAPLLEEDMPADEDYEDLRRIGERIGIDPVQDIDRVAFATYIVGGDEASPVGIATLDYDDSRLLAELADAETLEYAGRTLYRIDTATVGDPEDEDVAEPRAGEQEMEGEEDGTDRAYLVLLDDRSLLFGSEAGVKAAIDVDDGNVTSIRDADEMETLLEHVPMSANVWVVASSESWAEQLDAVEGQSAGMPVPTSAIEGIELMIFSVRVTDGFDIRLAGLAASAEDAELLSDSMQGMIAMGKMMLQQQQPEVFAILDRALTVGTSDRFVEFQARLSGDDVQTLRRLAEDQLPEAEA